MGKMIKANAENCESICDGARVRLKQCYGSGTKYFITYLPRGSYCMIADCKRDLRDGMGYIHSIYDIEAYEVFA